MTLQINLEVALQHAHAGLAVFPAKADKTPHVKRFDEIASTDEAVIRGWWARWPDALPALPCGANGLFVVDCDRKNDIDGVANFVNACKASDVALNGGLIVETPSGGQHFYFRNDGKTLGNSVGKLSPGVDTRGIGGYVIACGSALPDGRFYRVAAGSLAELQSVPESIARFLAKQETAAPPQDAPMPSHGPLDSDLAYAQAALKDECAKLAATPRQRNHAINNAAFVLGTFVANGSLEEREVVAALFEACNVNGYTSKPDGVGRATKTIHSGLRSGKQKPRELPSQTPLAKIELPRPTSQQSANKRRSVALTRMAEVLERPISWLWEGYLPLGKLTLLAGAGGTGKSTLAFSMAGTVSTAGHWPNGEQCKVAGNVLIWSSEDDPADVIKPRLLAMGADVNRVGTIGAVNDEAQDEVPFDPSRDIEALRNAAIEIGGVSLLIIDPIVSAVTGDMHKANDVRRSLQAIVNFAAEMNCAVIGITHFAKSTAGRNPSERVIGSQAFAAFARMVLVAAKDEDTDTRVFTRAKSNISIDAGGFHYTIQEVVLPSGIVTTRIVWGDAIHGSSRDILATVEKNDNPDESRTQLKEAKSFLQEELKDGARSTRELIELAKNQLGISEKTLRRAQHELGIVASKHGFQGAWMWSFPFSLPLLLPVERR